ncbi:MAG: phenylalanine--tRNA ligase subunit alpha [bacterium]|nr:phenylalanine--tRNA ligase subunit alpha [bacterium]
MSETNLQELFREAAAALGAARNADAAEEVRLRFLGRKSGLLTEVMRGLKDLSPEEKRTVGPLANNLRDLIEKGVAAIKDGGPAGLQEVLAPHLTERGGKTYLFEAVEIASGAFQAGAAAGPASPRIDLTVPGRRPRRGHRHPIVQTMDEIISVLTRLGYSVAEGPEVELDYYNFEALNIPKDHPARDMQDTFYVSDDVLLRTHTSPVQIRIMEKQPPPVKVIAPGKVFRCDADVTHSPMFHQVEGLYVDRGVSFTDLKGTLQAFVEALFGPEFRVRLRPSFFPFTEPSAEVDISCEWMNGGAWMEVLGAGMVDPAVLEAVGYDPEEWSGFAWGLGVERVAMLRYGISDIRLFFENDIRMLRQF